MKVTVILLGHPHEVPVGFGDSMHNVVDVVIESQRLYTAEEVRNWELRDKDGNLLSLDKSVSDLGGEGDKVLFLSPRAGTAA